MPVTISPKYWAEHMGLPYMQGAIRPQEMPPRNAPDGGFFSRSGGSRSFLRYGYGDLLIVYHGKDRRLRAKPPECRRFRIFKNRSVPPE